MTTDFKTFVPARTALTGANTAPDDVLPIIDVSASETKKITREEFQTYNAGTFTTDKKVLDLSATWNNAAVTFTGLKFNVTDTASNASSLLMDMQVGGVSKAKISKAGLFTAQQLVVAGGGNSTSFNGHIAVLGNVTLGNGFIGLNVDGVTNELSVSQNNAATGPIVLRPGSATQVEQRNSTNAQTFRLYNTYTDASNYERLAIGWAANVVSIKPENAGTGAARVLHISGLPTSNPGPGILWNNAGTPAIGT